MVVLVVVGGSQPYAEAGCRINNEIQNAHNITALQTNSSATVPDITSAVRICAGIQCFFAKQRGELLHSLQRNGTPPCRPYLPLETLRLPSCHNSQISTSAFSVSLYANSVPQKQLALRFSHLQLQSLFINM